MAEGDLDIDLFYVSPFYFDILCDSGEVKVWQVNLEELSHFMCLFCSLCDLLISMTR
jgi:hypothetical protein